MEDSSWLKQIHDQGVIIPAQNWGLYYRNTSQKILFFYYYYKKACSDKEKVNNIQKSRWGTVSSSLALLPSKH